jgi:phosphoribosylformylglycinamidine synthase
MDEFKKLNVNSFHIGKSIGYGMQSRIKVKAHDFELIDISTLDAIKKWERTSYELEKLQMNPECAIEEYESYEKRTGPKYNLTFDTSETIKLMRGPRNQFKVAVIREEGVNGDREMIATLMKAKFEVHDVTMTDLLERKTFLDNVSENYLILL